MWLGDSIGEMALYYALARIALLGGSFAPLGGQNLIEAAACGCPVVMGPHTYNFAQAAELALAARAALRVADIDAAVTTALECIAADADVAMAAAALEFAAAAPRRSRAQRRADRRMARRRAAASPVGLGRSRARSVGPHLDARHAAGRARGRSPRRSCRVGLRAAQVLGEQAERPDRAAAPETRRVEPGARAPADGRRGRP